MSMRWRYAKSSNNPYSRPVLLRTDPGSWPGRMLEPFAMCCLRVGLERGTRAGHSLLGRSKVKSALLLVAGYRLVEIECALS